jgi:hypothetical protein
LPAGADPYVPVFNKETVYVHCNADKVTVGEQVSYAWNTTAPATSFTANGGCGSLDTDKTAPDGVIWTGTHTGNLDRLTVHAHVIDVGPVRAGAYPEIYVDVNVQIDGNEVVSGVEAHLAPIPSSTGISRLLEFSVQKINLLKEEDYKEHAVTVSLESAPYLDGDQVVWVLDASEVRSGVTFSPTTLSGVRIDAG